MSQEETEDATTSSDEELSERSISTLNTSEAKAEHCMSDSVVTIDYDEATLRSQDVADEHSNTPVIGTNEYQSIALDLSKGKSAACGVSSKDSLLSFSQNIKFYSPTKQMDISNLNIEESKQSDATKCAKHNLPFKKRILSGEEYVSKPDSKKLNTSTESNLEPLSSNKKEVTEDTIQQPELAESDNGAIGIKGSSASVKDVDEIAALKAAVLARRALKVLSPEKEISVQSSSSHQIQTTSLDRIQMTSQHQIQIMNPDRIQMTSQHQIQMMDPPQEQRTSSDRIQGTSPDQIQRMGSDRIQRTNPSLLQMRNPILTQMISQNDQMEPQTPMTSQPQTPMTSQPQTPMTNLPLSQMTNLPLSQMTNLPLSQMTNLPLTPMTNLPLIPMTNLPLIPMTNLPLSQMTNLPLSQTTSTYPMFQMSPPQRPVGSTLQMLLAWPPQMPAVSPQRMLFSNPPQRPEGSLQREQGESPQRKPEFTSPRRPEFTSPRKPEFTSPRMPGFTPPRMPGFTPPRKPGPSPPQGPVVSPLRNLLLAPPLIPRVSPRKKSGASSHKKSGASSQEKSGASSQEKSGASSQEKSGASSQKSGVSSQKKPGASPPMDISDSRRDLQHDPSGDRSMRELTEKLIEDLIKGTPSHAGSYSSITVSGPFDSGTKTSNLNPVPGPSNTVPSLLGTPGRSATKMSKPEATVLNISSAKAAEPKTENIFDAKAAEPKTEKTFDAKAAEPKTENTSDAEAAEPETESTSDSEITSHKRDLI